MLTVFFPGLEEGAVPKISQKELSLSWSPFLAGHVQWSSVAERRDTSCRLPHLISTVTSVGQGEWATGVFSASS